MTMLEELNRRRLLQTAALYVAVAWGGTEILVFLVDALAGDVAADTARRYLAILLIAGFPAAMYLAWTRDLGHKARRLVSAGAVAVFITALLLYSLPEPSPEGALPTAANSIAVLPFESCEERAPNPYLAGGVRSAVRGLLAQRDYLNVASWRSVDSVVQTKPSTATIAQLLGVEYLLNGELCRDGVDLTLHAELTDGRGFIRWEGDFREVTNPFGQVERRLASLLDDQVAAQLGDATSGSSYAAVDQHALRHLLIGQEHSRLGETKAARAAFEKAIGIQPDFAEAIYEQALSIGSEWTIDDDASATAEAKGFLEKALANARAEAQRDPGNFKANYVAGRVLHMMAVWEDQLAYRDRHSIGDEGVAERRSQAVAWEAEAESYLRNALSIDPTDTDTRFSLVRALDNQGVHRRKESLAILKQGLASDLFNAQLSNMAAYRLVEFGQFREAMELLDGFEQLPQGKQDVWWTQLEILNNNSKFDEQFAYLIEIMRTDPAQLESLWPALAHLWRIVGWIHSLGLHEEAAYLFELVSRIPDPAENPWWRQSFLVDHYFYVTGKGNDIAKRKLEKFVGLTDEEILDTWQVETGMIAGAFWQTGEYERAIRLLESLELYPYESTRWSERRMMFPMGMADMYIQVGREDDAAPVLRRVVSELQLEVDAGVRHPFTLMLLSQAYAFQGKAAEALEILDLAIDYGAFDLRFCCEEYVTSASNSGPTPAKHWWDKLENEPELEQARSRMRAQVDQQRANIRALLGQNDVAGLLAPLTDSSKASAAME